MKCVSALLLAAALALAACASGQERLCIDSLPGEEGIPLNSPETARLEKIMLSDHGDTGYIATEYIEAANLQATVYIKADGKYCFAGDLGPLTDFHLDKSKKSNEFYEIVVNSKSGQSKFSRGFDFQEKTYVLSWCTVLESEKNVRRCTKNEQ